MEDRRIHSNGASIINMKIDIDKLTEAEADRF